MHSFIFTFHVLHFPLFICFYSHRFIHTYKRSSWIKSSSGGKKLYLYWLPLDINLGGVGGDTLPKTPPPLFRGIQYTTFLFLPFDQTFSLPTQHWVFDYKCNMIENIWPQGVVTFSLPSHFWFNLISGIGPGGQKVKRLRNRDIPLYMWYGFIFKESLMENSANIFSKRPWYAGFLEVFLFQ